MAKEIITEKEISDPVPTEYTQLYAAGENMKGDKLMIRNTTTDRLRFRIDEDDSNTFTVSPNQNMIIGGFIALRGNKIEVMAVTDITASVRLNAYS